MLLIQFKMTICFWLSAITWTNEWLKKTTIGSVHGSRWCIFSHLKFHSCTINSILIMLSRKQTVWVPKWMFYCAIDVWKCIHKLVRRKCNIGMPHKINFTKVTLDWEIEVAYKSHSFQSLADFNREAMLTNFMNELSRFL